MILKLVMFEKCFALDILNLGRPTEIEGQQENEEDALLESEVREFVR